MWLRVNKTFIPDNYLIKESILIFDQRMMLFSSQVFFTREPRINHEVLCSRLFTVSFFLVRFKNRKTVAVKCDRLRQIDALFPYQELQSVSTGWELVSNLGNLDQQSYLIFESRLTFSAQGVGQFKGEHRFLCLSRVHVKSSRHVSQT